MALTHFLLEPNFNSSPLFRQISRSCPRPLLWPCSYNINIDLKRNYSPCYTKTSPKFNTKRFIMNHKPKVGEYFDENKGGECTSLKNEIVKSHKSGIDGMIWRSMENVMKALRITVISGFLLGLLFLYDHRQGRVALACSGGCMGGSSFSSDSSDSSSSSSSSSDGGYSSWDDSYINTSSTDSSSSKTPRSKKEVAIDAIITLSLLFGFCYLIYWCTKDTTKKSVLKLQVGLLGTGRSLQRDLNRIAESADTSTPKGFYNVLQEAIQALLRHPEFYISGYSYVNVKSGVGECEKRFNQVSVEERGKFDEETLVNLNNIIKKSETSQSSNELRNEYLVVTIIVAADGVPKLPPIKSSAELKEALQKLTSIPSRSIMGVQVLWTPQKEDESLTEQRMLKDYPLLHRF